MTAMQSLRHARQLTRFVLVWFALALGVAVASPMVKTPALALVCTNAGVVSMALAGGDADLAPSHAHTLECPLCLMMGAPPPVALAPATLPIAPLDLGAGLLTPAVSALDLPLPPPRGPPLTL